MALFDPGPGSRYKTPPAPGPASTFRPPPRPPSNIPPGASTYQSDQTYDPVNVAGRVVHGLGGLAGDAAGAIGDFFGGVPNPLASTPHVSPKDDPGFFQPDVDRGLAGRQLTNIGALEDAAAGRVASPAEIQLQEQSGLNAARQFGLASALQGRNPGAALRSARLGSLATNAQTNVDAAMMRAKEQQAAREALMQAMASARGQEQNLLGIQSDYLKSLNDANAKEDASKRTFLGGIAGTAAALLSDRTTKRDIKPADMSKLAASLKSYRFRYKDEANGEGERVGVMAQDVAKGGNAGKLIIRRRDDGKIGLDVGNAVGAALAMSAQALREAKKAA